jgi:hypothetical protein
MLRGYSLQTETRRFIAAIIFLKYAVELYSGAFNQFRAPIYIVTCNIDYGLCLD